MEPKEPKPTNGETQFTVDEHRDFLDAVTAVLPELDAPDDAPVPPGSDTILESAAEYTVDNTRVMVRQTKVSDGYHTFSIHVAPPMVSLLNKISVYSYDAIDQKFKYRERYVTPRQPRIPHQATDNPHELARNAIENAKLEDSMTRFLPEHYKEVMAILAKCSSDNLVTESK